MNKIIISISACCFIAFIYSCGGGLSKPYSPEPTKDSSATATVTDTTKMSMPDTTATSAPPVTGNPHPADSKELPVESVTKGYAIVYCPAKMITHVPSIINAQISKDELSVAYSKFIQKIQDQNPGKKVAAIEKDVKGDSIDIYEKMSVAIEFDPDDFKQVSKDDNLIQSFNDKRELEWDWTIKPLHSTERSIIKFKFYGTDPTTNQPTNILEKTINISVQVDARGYFEKWADFLLDDPKTTITVIVIPFITFLFGFVTGKKKKA